MRKIKGYLLFFTKLILPFWYLRIENFLRTGKDMEKLPPPTKGYFRAYFFEPDGIGHTLRYHEVPLYLDDKFNEDFKGKIVGLTRHEVVQWVMENKNDL